MRMLMQSDYECDACFAASRARGGASGEAGGRSFLEAFVGRLSTCVPRERSGLAYAAGYAGLLSLFRYSFKYLTVSGWWPAWTLGTLLTLCFSLLAPLALVLSFAAAVSLDRSPRKAGRLPAVVGLLFGWVGSYTLLFVLDELWQWLASLG